MIRAVGVPVEPRDGQAGRAGTPAFRRARARLAAHALHHKRPDIAREAGRKGGEVTSQRYPLGPRAWGVAMAMRRWHGTELTDVGSRAPMAGSGSDGGGAPEPGPAAALRRRMVAPRRRRRNGPEQARLL